MITTLNHFTYLLETPYWLLKNSIIGDKYPFTKKYELFNEINQIGTRYSGKTISNIKMFGELLKISLLIKEPIRIIASMYWGKDLKVEWQPFFGQILYIVKIFILNWC